MIKYNNLLDELFKDWKSSYGEDGKDKFCEDGIMLKADKSIDVDELWEKSKRKIMFMLKDCPDGYGYDTRTMLTDDKHGEENRNLKNKFTTKLAKILYGLIKGEADFRVNDKYVDEHMDEVKEAWNTIPFAFVETKKLAGGKDVSSDTMRKVLDRDKLFLAKEIDILRPNIIVCFDGEDNIFNYVTKFYLQNATPTIKRDYKYPHAKFNCCLHYYEQNNMAVIKAYHPSYVMANWAFQERIYSPFCSFLGEYKNM